MRRYGLIGYPLGHSFSQRYFTEKFQREGILDACFDLFPIEHIDSIKSIFQSTPELKGLAVTIPHKTAVIPYLDDLEDSARKIGAVNGIRNEQGRWIGFNSDYLGFEKTLLPHLKSHHDRALILGTGGSAKAVSFVLDRLGIPYQFVSRNPTSSQVSYSALDASCLAAHRLIVQCTPVGMHPKQEASPLTHYAGIGSQHLLYDLIYNPEETIFLQSGKKLGATVVNGLEMLHAQAGVNWRKWNGLAQ
jgi:shikimate dehydrogenase